MRHKTSIKLIIHSLFWIFYIVVVFLLNPSHGEYNLNWFDKIDYKLLLLVLVTTYVNDQLLLPYFFKRKAYVVYTLALFGLLFLATTFYCYYILICSCSLSSCFSKNLWMISLPVVFLSFIWLILQFFDKQKELEMAHKERLEMELKFLKSQINPHVLFNNINTIYAQAVKGSDNVAEMILMLSENLKYILDQSNDTLVPLEKDIAFIENYLEFQELRTQGINNIIYSKKIDSYNYSIAPLILIDLIENAFKYSVYKDNELSDINIYLSIQKGKLHFICKNEFDTILQQEKEITQIGLKNFQKRLNLIYKDSHVLDITKDDGIFTVNLKIDLE